MSDSLTEHDLALFAKLGIPKELLELAGVTRVTDAQAREDYGIRGAGDMAGVACIYFDPATMGDGSRHRHYVRIRRDHPEVEDGREKKKYVAPYGDKKHFYFPPTPKLFADVTVPIILVEAEKSVLAVTGWCERTGTRLLPLAMGGCWNWRGQVGIQATANGERVPEHGPIMDLNICRDGRKTYVLLDANCSTNPKMGQARKELVRQLRKQKADVVVLDLPPGHGNGPDDFLSSAGDAALVGLLEKGESTKSQHSAVIETTEQVFSDEGGRKTAWLSPPFVPVGGLVQLIGKIKIAGKTTFVMAMVHAILTGEPPPAHRANRSRISHGAGALLTA